MGSKISLLVYEWPLIRCKIWYMNGSFFKIWPNLSQNWLKFKKILEKIGNFVQNLAQNWADWFMNGLLFLEKLVFVWVYFQIPWRHIPTKPNLSTPPDLDLVIMQVPVSHKAVYIKPSNCLTRLLLGFYLNLYTKKFNDDLQVKDFSPSNC